jgi:hypothetical protein
VSEAAEAFARQLAGRPELQGTDNQLTNRTATAQPVPLVVRQPGFARVQSVQANPMQAMPHTQRAEDVLLAVAG